MENVVEEAFPEVKSPNWSKCSVCDDISMNEDVQKFLPCLHFVCSQNCLTSIIINDPTDVRCVKCTICKRKHPYTDAISSAFLQEVLERKRLTEEAMKKALEIPTCTYCVRKNDAVSWCEQCSDYLCVSCTEQHEYTIKTRIHTLTYVSEKKSELPDLKLTSHTICQLHSKPLTQFCTSCTSTLCDICALKHIGHAMESLKELAYQTRTSIRKSLTQISSLMPKFQEIENILLHKAQQMLETQKNFLINEASAQLTRLLSALMKREMEQRKELTETVVHKVKEFNLKRLKVSSLRKQSQQFLEMSHDLLNEASDCAITTNRKNYETQLFNIIDTSEQFDEQSKIDAYIEKGFNFVMDKSVGLQAEKHINLFAKMTYYFNPKAPTEIKMSGSAFTNKTYSRNDIRENIVPVRPPLSSEASNDSQQQLQTRSNNKPSPVKDTEGIEKTKSSEKPSVVSCTMGNQGTLENEVQSENESNIAKTSKGYESSNVVDQDPYASLYDQVIIELADDNSEGMEEDVEVDDEQGLQEDNITIILDDTEKEISTSDDDLDFPRKNVAKQSPSKQGKSMQRFGKKMEDFEGGSQTEDTDQGEAMSENNRNNSASEDESQNDAPDLSPESMKSPPKLQKESPTRVRRVKPHPTDYKNPSDSPPKLDPSVNLLELDGETTDLKPQKIKAKRKRTPVKYYESPNLTVSDSQDSGTGRMSTRSHSVSRGHNRNKSPIPRKRPSNRRRACACLDSPSEDEDRRRSDSRLSSRLRCGTESDLSPKRKRKKKPRSRFRKK